MHLLWALLVGAFVGWVASLIVKGEGLGLLGDICIGILGAILGDFGARFLGIVTYSTLGRLAISVVGAVLLLMVLSALFGKRGKS
jgi:uncharacterized membrane protein YeaQ/YmgE (transglycosylase-associated protein family)